MTRFSIRARLTLAYAALLAIVLVAFTFITLEAMRISALSAADDELRSRVRETQSLWYHGRGLSARTRSELDQHTGDVFRIEQGGRLLYQSKTPFDEHTMRMIRAPLSGDVTIRMAIPLRPYEEVIARFRIALLSAVPIALLIAAGGGYWLSGRVLRPVDRITQEARAITADDLGLRVVLPESRDELRLLAETINAMLDRIESAFRRLVQFTADASHELRSPVALMRTTAEVALRRPRDEGGYREALQQVLAESERLSLMIEDLLLLARSDAGADALERKPIDSAGPLRAALARIERPVHPAIDDGVIVEANTLALQQLFTILLDNAVKYSTDAIDVSLHARNGSAVIQVSDRGIGIAAEDLPHVFERFYRADKARSRGGAGLGLAIARRIAEIHGGTIEVVSEPGAGSTFTVTLPRFQERFSRGA
ncbi:MAG TPA: ATP-binding protein [Thermoanaerobaculia bacterium]|nr:ATP-binding protein [Thermoanaerobaculia bacterium]